METRTSKHIVHVVGFIDNENCHYISRVHYFCSFGVNLRIQIIFSVPGLNCMEDTNGFSYSGNQSVSESGKACLPWWVILLIFEGRQVPDEKIVDAQNFCRNVALFEVSSSKTRKPACATDADSREYEYCDIPQCSDVTTTQTQTTIETSHAISKLLDIKYMLLILKYICNMIFEFVAFTSLNFGIWYLQIHHHYTDAYIHCKHQAKQDHWEDVWYIYNPREK